MTADGKIAMSLNYYPCYTPSVLTNYANGVYKDGEIWRDATWKQGVEEANLWRPNTATVTRNLYGLPIGNVTNDNRLQI